ncbi:MAG: excinuclease ABC subunit UvrA, partial [Bacteroidetes bacterium]|nr:excinuclease ABC subunit UvrA [Bacteroidota bacterium]
MPSSRPSRGAGLDRLTIRGARVNNLKNISLDLPRNALIVVTGVSGSGKSSLAFDTIYAEGQRRYVESLSSYARQFLERMEKPDVDLIQGISPAIAIEQKTTSRNPRSTVATTTEVYDYCRLLFGRIGRTICPSCGSIVRRDTVSTAVDRLHEHPEGTKLVVTFPLHEHSGRSLPEEIAVLKQRGFFRLWKAGEIIDLERGPIPGRSKKGLAVVVDRLAIRRNDNEFRTRLSDSIQTAFVEGGGYARVELPDPATSLTFTQHLECPNDGTKFEEPDPRMFSFNNPVGACPECQGFGRAIGIDMDLVVPDPSKTLRQGAVVPWSFPRWREYYLELLKAAPKNGLPLDVPWRDLSAAHQALVQQGGQGFDGLRAFFAYIEKRSYKLHYRVFMSRFRGYTTCPSCQGSRLRREALNLQVGGKTIHDVVQMTIDGAKTFFEGLELTPFEHGVARRVVEEIRKRLKFLSDVGIGYLTLDRLSMTLSGGESQRINLATSLGSSLMGSLYVLDEPSIGLHPRDSQRLIAMLRSLRDLGNTVMVVEHDEEMMRSADVVVDLGPKAGELGGEVVFAGPTSELLSMGKGLTADYLSGRRSIPVPSHRRPDPESSIFIRGASEHNLKSIDVRIPLGIFVCITGVSGSGKSTLVHNILFAGLQKLKGGFEGSVGKMKGIEGAERVDRVELVDQSPIGRSPRSNPVTYIKVFDLIRDLLASTPASKVKGFKPGHFSFNVPGGRCETCEGDGVQRIEMQFLADLYLTCESCKGKRFKQDVLDIRFRGKNIDDVLGMTVAEAIRFFGAEGQGRKAAAKLKVLEDVGLGYVRLGQPATSLSGGEAQRVKLAAHLASPPFDRHTLFLFDEPTTGLHFDDIAKLIGCFNALIDAG